MAPNIHDAEIIIMDNLRCYHNRQVLIKTISLGLRILLLPPFPVLKCSLRDHKFSREMKTIYRSMRHAKDKQMNESA